MKNNYRVIAVLLISISCLSSCATIFGGARYNATVVVNNKPNATIIYQGENVGRGKAYISVKRKEANKFSFIVKEDGCEEQKYSFRSRTFRGWALFGSLITFTGTINAVPVLPIGAIIDVSTGAVWKPDVYEKGVIKQNYKNYKYLVDYTKSCQPENATANLNDLLYLTNGKIIRGKIIENLPNQRVQIRILDGNIELYPYSEIEKITQESQTNK